MLPPLVAAQRGGIRSGNERGADVEPRPRSHPTRSVCRLRTESAGRRPPRPARLRARAGSRPGARPASRGPPGSFPGRRRGRGRATSHPAEPRRRMARARRASLL